MPRRTLLTVLVLAAVAPWLEDTVLRKRNLTICRSNLKNLATALEMYSSDNGGRYPLHLERLIGGHLKALPDCPVAGFSTYAYEVSSHPDGFTVGCRGRYHGEPSQAETREAWWERFGSSPGAFPCYRADAGFPDCPY